MASWMNLSITELKIYLSITEISLIMNNLNTYQFQYIYITYHFLSVKVPTTNQSNYHSTYMQSSPAATKTTNGSDDIFFS